MARPKGEPKKVVSMRFTDKTRIRLLREARAAGFTTIPSYISAREEAKTVREDKKEGKK